MTPRHLTLSLTLTAVLALSACSLDGGATDDSAAAEGSHPDSLTYALSVGSAGTIQRITGAQNPGSQIAMAMCEPPTGIEEDGTVFMRGAKAVTSSDQKMWTVDLQTDRTFSDGTPITAKTYVDTLNFIAYGPNAMPANYAYIDIEGYAALNPGEGEPTAKTLSGLKLVDDDTFTVTMTKPYNDFPYLVSTLAYCPMPESAFADPTAYDRNPVANGPYVLSKLEPKLEAVLTRDLKYKGWVPEGAAQTLTYRLFTDTNTAYQEVAAGNVDVMRNVPPSLIAQAQKTLGKDQLTAVSPNTLETFISWPTYLDKQFPKPVREAFSMLIDREGISKNLFLGSSQGAQSLMPDSVPAHRENPCGEACTFSPDKAKSKLAAAGFTGTIPLHYSSDNTSDAATALAISNEAKKVGLTVTPTPMPSAQLDETTIAYGLTGPRINLWGSSFPSASEWVASVLNDGNYHLKYVNADAQKAVDAGWAAKTPDEATSHWQAAEDTILADQNMQPLYYQVMYIAHSECVKPHAAGGDMQFYRSEITCDTK